MSAPLWPAGRYPTVASSNGKVGQLGYAGEYPVPRGRGRWRLTLHSRAFAAGIPYAATAIAEVTGAGSRQLSLEWNKAASFTFALRGTSSAASLIEELRHDIVAWRWDDTAGVDIPVFRGVVCQSQDTLSEQADTTTFTAHSYLKMLERRLLTSRATYAQVEQDDIARDLLARAKGTRSTSGTVYASYLPLVVATVDPAGASRGASGIKRDRTYEAQSKLDELLANLAVCEQGFDVDVLPNAAGDDALRVFYPYAGELRRDVVLEYGSSVSALSRSTNSGDYGNAWRVVGGSSNPNDSSAPPLYAERWNTDATDASRRVGLWHSPDNASDVTVQATLNDKAGADLALGGVLMPSYSLDLRPGWYTHGRPRLGDVCTLRVRAGRLSVDSDARVLGMSFDVNDDGGETVKLTVGRPDVTFSDLFTRADRDIAALARR